MKNCIGIINSNIKYNDYQGLANSRPDYMLPFAGRYRVIDISLSNMANYDLSHIMLYGGKNLRSTMDHIGDGKNWELNRRNNGLMINPPSFDSSRQQISEIQTYFDSLPYYEYSKPEYVYITNPMVLTKVNIRESYNSFLQSQSDIMLMYKTVNDENGNYIGRRRIILDENGELINIGTHLGTEKNINLFVGQMFIKKEVFIRLVKQATEFGNARTLIEAIVNNKNDLKITTYDIGVHADIIHDLNSYYKINMSLLDANFYKEFFYTGGAIYTKSKDEPSALYREGSKVSNSLVANGCIIEGQVENSILFRGVHVQKGAIVKNSILIQKTTVEENAVLVNVVADKYATIKSGVSLVGSPNSPMIVLKNQIIGN